MSNEKAETFTKEQVIAMVEELLQRPDLLLDAVQNEDTDQTAETLVELAISFQS